MRLAVSGCVMVLALGGCVSAAESPAWLAEREAQLQNSYPELTDVPRMSDANTDPAYWAQAQAELLAAGAAVRASPRSQPVTAADDPQAFLDEARREIEEARQSHSE